MRGPWVIAVALCAVLAPADTIYLKSGRTIVADHVTEKNGRVYYEIGDNSYAIPKSLVNRIETAAPAAVQRDEQPVPPVAKTSREQPAVTAAPLANPPSPSPAPPRFIRDGHVDAEALAALERAGHARETAAGFFAAGKHEFDAGNPEQARFYFERALMFAPQDALILTQYASVLVQLGRAGEAVPVAERAARLSSNSADAFAVLGFAYYANGRGQEALNAWKRSVQLRPDERLQGHIAKAERELSAEAEFAQSDSGHFTFRYEGSSTPPELTDAVQTALEKDYDEFVAALGIVPAASITVSLYTDQAFFDVTQAPSWTGALNDGKLRIPVQGISTVTTDLARVLRHELAHSFVNQATRGRCPQWLNEGIAQLLEPRTLGPIRGQHLAQIYTAGQQIPLNMLELSFLSFSPFEATVAYDESLATAEYMHDTFGMSQISALMSRIGEGSSTETALRITVRTGYAGLEERIARYLTAKYAPPR